MEIQTQTDTIILLIANEYSQEVKKQNFAWTTSGFDLCMSKMHLS